MKEMKRLVSLVLTTLMILVMAVPALADGGYVPGKQPADAVPADKKTAQIYIAEPLGESNTGHTYRVYQFFVGEPAIDENGKPALKNLENGYSHSKTGKFTPDDLLALLNDSEMPLQEKNIKIYDVYTNKPQVYATMTNSNVGAYLDVEPGYYLLVDDSNDAAYNIYGMAVDQTEAGRLNYEPKAKLPTFRKEVRDNDADNWGKIADFSYTSPGATGITPNLDGFNNPNTLNAPNADAVAFRLTATLGDNYDMYETYQLIFYDEPSYTFKFIRGGDENLLYRVEVVGEDGTSKFDTFSLNKNNGIQSEYFEYKEPEPNTTEIVFNIKDVKKAFLNDNNPVELAAGDEIRITYYAYTDKEDFPVGDADTLTELGNYPATNKAYLEYNNNPYNSEKTGTTPEDYATVYSYGLMVMKEGSDQKPLSGAEFKLYKEVGENNYVPLSEMLSETYGDYRITGNQYTNAWFWDKLDSGKYMLEETDPPEGYNPLDEPVIFNVNRDPETGKVTLTQSDTDKKAMVTVDRTTQTVYRFLYYPWNDTIQDYDFDNPESIYIKEDSDFFRGEGSFAASFYEPQYDDEDNLLLDYSGTGTSSLKALVDLQDPDEAVIDEDNGIWMLDYYYNWDLELVPYEYQLYTITVRNGPTPTGPFQLPTTGGSGTILIYAVGGMMIVGAGVLLVTRKRMSGKN